MTLDIYHGNTGSLTAQLQTSIRATPGVPAAKRLKFDEFSMSRAPVRSPNNTIRNVALMNKNDEMDERPEATFTAAFCLNDIGWWLTMLLGQPTTSGAGPTYTHEWTFDAGLRPTALVELALRTVSGTARRRRGLGLFLNQLNWDPMAEKQQVQGQLMYAQEVLPPPSTDFHAAAAFYPLSMAATHRGRIFDGTSDVELGQISAGSVNITNNAEGIPLADGERGYGGYIIGSQALPALNGQLTALFTDDTLWDKAKDNESSALVFRSANAANTHHLTTSIGQAAFNEPSWTSGLAAGKFVQVDWYAHDGADVTFTLVNAVTSYAA